MKPTDAPVRRLLRIKEVQRMVGLSKSTLYARIASGTFPAPIRLGDRAVAWPDNEVISWIEARPRASRRPAEVS